MKNRYRNTRLVAQKLVKSYKCPLVIAELTDTNRFKPFNFTSKRYNVHDMLIKRWNPPFHDQNDKSGVESCLHS